MDTNFLADKVPIDALARRVYDTLMRDIEPELLSKNIPNLEAAYASETPEAHAKRKERYKRAFEDYDARFEAFMGGVKAEARANRRDALEDKECAARAQDSAQLESLESAFSQM